MTSDEIIALFIMIDNFFISFSKTTAWIKTKHLWLGQRGPLRKLSLSEVVTLNIIRFYLKIDDLKNFHRQAKINYSHFFPHIPNYENFLKASNNSAVFTYFFLYYMLNLNKFKHSPKHYLDSTDVTVCKNHNISSHKVAKAIARRGKTTKGWFFGIKLHGVCNILGDFENIFFTSGDVHDNLVFEQILKNIFGDIYCDAGYLLNPKELTKYFEKNQRIFTAVRRNMKRLMSKEQCAGLRERSVIENNWNVLKERFNFAYHKARSILGMFRHFFYSLSSFMLRKYFKDNNFRGFRLLSGYTGMCIKSVMFSCCLPPLNTQNLSFFKVFTKEIGVNGSFSIPYINLSTRYPEAPINLQV